MKLYNSEAYNHRDVLGLSPINQWTLEQEKVQRAVNRILQPGFAARSADSMIADAKLAGVRFLAEVCCPSAEAALTLHLARDMSIKYKMETEEMGDECNKAYFAIEKSDPEMIPFLENKINEIISTIDIEKITNNAKIRLEKNKITSPTDEQLAAATRIEIDIERKKITYKAVSSYLEGKQKVLDSIGLEKKTLFNKGENQDFSIMGAAGSGKSTISGEILAGHKTDDQVIFSPDNYRVFELPNSPKNPNPIGKNRFIETQDMAYFTKKLVEDGLKDMAKQGLRPNIVFDGITLQDPIKSLIKEGNLKSAVAAFAPSGYDQIAERADRRAVDPNAAPADKDRFVNTTALLEGHANVSGNLLTSVPQNVSTIVYSTNVERGAEAKKIGVIDPSKKILAVDDLKVMSEFFNKTNINKEAVNPVSLIYKRKEVTKDTSVLTQSTHPENKAKAVLDLVKGSDSRPSYAVELKDGDVVYARLKSDTQGRVDVIVNNREVFNQRSTGNTIEAGILRSVIRQAIVGIEDSVKNFSENDRSFQERLSNYLDDKIQSEEKIKTVKPNLTVRIKRTSPTAAQLKKVLQSSSVASSKSVISPSVVKNLMHSASMSSARVV